MGESGPRRLVNLFLGRIEPAELNVAENGVVKQKCLLRDETDLFAERLLRERAQILAIDRARCPRSDRKAAG